MARSKSISIPITGNSAPLRKELKKASQDLSAFGKAQATWAKASTLAYAAAGSAVVGFATDVVKAALEDQKSQALLEKQLRTTTGALTSQIAGMENYISSTQLATNITDDQLRPALAQFVRVTGDAKEAQKLLNLATDTSIGSGRDFGSVVNALSKAYGGNYAALSKLGIAIDKSKTSTVGFSAVADQLTAQFGGSAAVASETLAGRVENLKIRWDELKEQIGTQLLPIVDKLVTKFSDLFDTINRGNYVDLSKNVGEISLDFVKWATGVDLVKDAIKGLNPWADDSAQKTEDLRNKYQDLSQILVEAAGGPFDGAAQALEDQADAAARADRNIGYLRDQYRKLSEVTLQLVADEKKQQDEAAKTAATRAAAAATARKSYAETAKSLREALGQALEDSKQQLADAKQAADDFGKSLAFSFGVSLAGAYDTASDSEKTYTDALQGRKAAYDALDVAKAGTDLSAYLKAVQDVAAAEQQVTDAQKARVTPASAFASQIEAAKTFGTNLQALIGQGLKSAGLQQLLDLGPVAGAEVTKAILDGTAGITVGGLNSSLASLAEVQSGLAGGITQALAPKGAINAAQSQVDALSSASIGSPGVGQGFTINIVAGVGDPVEIGRQVKKVLGEYDNRAGTLVVQGPKKRKK